MSNTTAAELVRISAAKAAARAAVGTRKGSFAFFHHTDGTKVFKITTRTLGGAYLKHDKGEIFGSYKELVFL